ncbi:MAG: ribosomal protein S18-alanine N-acetyltransferase [Lachnospiraceae bacterium]|nr:ribosomal protein S18-alanine N-acetyltransferase [Lachnospiraceae bacterium]
MRKEASMREDVVIRPMQAEDVSAICAIEQASFSDPWSAEGFLNSLANERAICLSAICEGEPVGYALLYTVLDEADLVNIAVAEQMRQCGIGRALLKEVILQAKEKGVLKIFLEVRKSNYRARLLYGSFGFLTLSVRKGFYEKPKEDAICMMLPLERAIIK